MSARARKQLLQPTLADIAQFSDDDDDDDDEDCSAVNTFSVLEKKKKNKNKHKKKTENTEKEKEEEDEVIIPTQPSTKKPANKNKKKNQQRKPQHKEEEDFDALLEQFAHTKKDGTVSSEPLAEKPLSCRNKLLMELECSQPCFNRHNEMRRLFGKAAMSNKQPKKSTYQGKPVVYRKSIFVPIEDIQDWPPFSSHGLEMVKSETREDDDGGTVEFTTRGNNEQEHADQLFTAAVLSHNPRAFGPVLRQFPYHIPTLLQMSEVLHSFGEHQQANDDIKVTLYAIDMISRPCAFNWCSSLINKTHHRTLPWSTPGNRPILQVVKKHGLALDRNGCYRTALEYLKMLYSLDLTDPLYTLLLVDHLSLRSNQHSWFLEFWTALSNFNKWAAYLPNLMFSKALSKYLMESKSTTTTTTTTSATNSGSGSAATEESGYGGEGTHAASLDKLCNAIVMYPQAVACLLQKCDLMNEQVLTHSLFTTECTSMPLRKLFEMWADKQYETWKPPDVQMWLQNGINKALEVYTTNPELKATIAQDQDTMYQQTALLAHYGSAVKPDLHNDATGGLPPEEMMHMMGAMPDDAGMPVGMDDIAVDPAALGDQNPLMLFLQSMLPWNTLQQMAHQAGQTQQEGEQHEDAPST